MIIVMKEHYQDAKQHLFPDQQYEVDVALGKWLLDNRKAVKVEPVVEARHLDVEPQFEQAEEPPQPKEFKNRKSGRRAQ